MNGCYWHRHSGCKYAYESKSRVEFWQNKFNRNIARDREVRNTLEAQGIRMLIVWECTVKKMIKQDELEVSFMDIIDSFIQSDSVYLEL